VDRAEWRRAMSEWWRKIDKQALASKQSQTATLQLIERFRELNEESRPVVAAILYEWVLSTNARQRFDALAAIQEFRLDQAVPQLRELESRLGTVPGPEAEAEAEKVRALLALWT
jgi:hypothetical protein